MAMGTSLVALAMVTAGQAPAATAVAPPIYYQAKVLTIEGTGWRSESFHRMRPVARQGTSTIWTADRAMAESLARSAKASTGSPKIMASDSSSVSQQQAQFYVSHLERVSNGPINQASRVAYVPEVSSLPEGFQARVSGRRIDQGVLAHVALEDTHVVRIETVGLPETIKNEAKASQDCPVELAQKVIRTVMNGSSEAPETSIRGQIQVPEVATGRAEGEWLVPNDSVLLVSLGIHTTADVRGMAVTEERVAIVDFDASPLKPIATEGFLGTAGINALPIVAGEPMPIAVANLPQATPPSRSLPRSIDVDGKEIELPPLPEGLASADLNQIEPGTKLASPQMNIKGSTADAALARTSFEDVPTGFSPVPVMGDFARMPLYDFARRLFERMGEYQMDIDFAADGKSCQISLRDANSGSAEADPACPPEPRCENGKEADPKVALAAMIGEMVENVRKSPDFARMKPGQMVEIDLSPGGMKMVPAARKPGSTAADWPDCDECLKEIDASCPASKDPLTTVFEMVVKKMADGSPAATTSTIDLRSALKAPGQTETTVVPLSDKLSLEIKATVVPRAAAATKADAPAGR